MGGKCGWVNFLTAAGSGSVFIGTNPNRNSETNKSQHTL